MEFRVGGTPWRPYTLNRLVQLIRQKSDTNYYYGTYFKNFRHIRTTLFTFDSEHAWEEAL
jgi:hypothetical protein